MKKEQALLIIIENIKDYIQKYEITTYQLSKKTKIHYNLVCELLYKDKRKDIKLSSICTYAEALGIDPIDLLTPHFFRKK